ncbi:MAG: CDP-glucose 4,6-dehydratase [Acidobacteriota bacterium]
MFAGTYRGRRVLVTGHTGFKGSWLAAWLSELGATVAGYACGVPTTPSHFEAAALRDRLADHVGDIRDRARLGQVLDEFAPEIVFHLAAQALVRQSYADPVTTFETNAIGTLNVLECARTRPGIRAVVLITSDKAYRNVEWVWGYRETDALGGDDPYSGSKACAELIAHSYVRSFFPLEGPLAAVATTRAGNVIGGGDWAADRIVPDCVRAWSAGQVVRLRHPQATRPWQHVLEPLSGYLALGARLWTRSGVEAGAAYNFGPDGTVNHPVEALMAAMARLWPEARWERDPGAAGAVKEAMLLKLCCDRALFELQWRPVLSFDECVRMTTEWYRDYYANPAGAPARTQAQIGQYTALASERGLAWAGR